MNKKLAIARALLIRVGRFTAIRYLRRLGLTYQTARTTVQELSENAPWYSKIEPNFKAI